MVDSYIYSTALRGVLVVARSCTTTVEHWVAGFSVRP